MYAEVAWVLGYSVTQVQPQVLLDPDYLPDYLSVSYDYESNNQMMCLKQTQSLLCVATVQRWKFVKHWVNIQQRYKMIHK